MQSHETHLRNAAGEQSNASTALTGGREGFPHLREEEYFIYLGHQLVAVGQAEQTQQPGGARHRSYPGALVKSCKARDDRNAARVRKQMSINDIAGNAR